MTSSKVAFTEVLGILTEIGETASTLGKQRLISANAGNELFRKVVYYALDSFKMFKLREPVRPAMGGEGVEVNEIFEALDSFCHRPATTKADREAFQALMAPAGEAACEVINRVLQKDLRIKAGVKLFKKADPRFADLPEHQPMKGHDNVQKFYKDAKSRSNICWSTKLDGTRTWAVLSKGNVLYLSSNGKELENFHCFDERLAKVFAEYKAIGGAGEELILDGEVTNIQGDFSRHMSQFRRLKNMDPSGFRFRVFDVVVDQVPFVLRYDTLMHLGLPVFDRDRDDLELVSYLPHLPLDRNPMALAKEQVALGFEGIMMKTWDNFYEQKRSNAWCKVKTIKTDDLEVIGAIEGTRKYLGMLGALIVMRNGVKIEVGSGYTDEERQEFWKDRPRMIEVKYQEVTNDGSLRFPIFVRVREDK